MFVTCCLNDYYMGRRKACDTEKLKRKRCTVVKLGEDRKWTSVAAGKWMVFDFCFFLSEEICQSRRNE